MCTIYGDGGGEREETHGKSHSVCRLHSLSNSGEYSKKNRGFFILLLLLRCVFFVVVVAAIPHVYVMCCVSMDECSSYGMNE